MASSYGFDISAAGAQRERSRAVAVLRLPGRGQGAERRRHVAGPDLDVPGHLFRARSRRRRPDRRAGAGDRRRLRHQAAHRPVSADSGVRRALRRQSHLGDRVDRRHGRRRPIAHDEDELPPPADALQPRSRAGAEPDDLVSPRLPDGFRRFAAKVAIDTSSLQFESDEIMRRAWGDDGAIACCVSPMLLGKQMQFFGARANLAKVLLYAINGGRDEISGEQVGPASGPSPVSSWTSTTSSGGSTR